MMLPITSITMKLFDYRAIEKPLLKLTQQYDIKDKNLVFINPAESFSVSFLPFFCDNHELSPPAQTHLIVSGLTPRITIKRIDDATIEVEPENGFITSDLDRLFRGSTHPMHIGQQIKAGDMQVKVLTLTEDGRPLRVHFTFPHSLEDESMAFYAWEGGGFVPFKPPKKGQMTSLEMEMKKFIPEIFTMKSDEKSRYQARF